MSFKTVKIRQEETSSIAGIQFGILSPETILKRSVVSITEPTLYDSSGEPKLNGLFDPRMGVIDRNRLCKTCEQTYVLCPGHFGHIELGRPVYYVQFITQIKKILQCVCIRCSKLLINRDDPFVKNIMKTKKPEERLDIIKNKVKTFKFCGRPITSKGNDNEKDNSGCGAELPSKYMSQDLDHIIVEWTKEIEDEIGVKTKEKVKQIITPELALSILKRITIEDAKVIGFSPDWCMPHWLICSVLPVAPPSVRPSVKLYNNQRSEDDITSKYNDIIKHNNILKSKLENRETSEDQISTYTNLIQYHIATLIDNDVKQPAQNRSGRSLKTFKQRLHGKDGRIRSNLMGKRVDFSARSVISPDSSLNIEELGVPKKIAMNLTYPEVVNKYNMNKMYQLVRNGCKVYPGAKSYKRGSDGVVWNLEYKNTNSIILEEGDIINRHLIDGDYVLFNRQPSLHKMSMMAHKVRVMEGNTFRLNVDVCTPYNADFDGDEMNMHVPQSIQTSMELKYLAAVPKQIISPSTNSPIIKPSQDNLLGLFKITDDNVFFNQKEFMNLMMGVLAFSGELPEPDINNNGIIRWTGKQAVSIVLPNINLNYNYDNNNNVKDLIIKDGKIIQGQIDKKTSNKIVHTIFSEYGYKEAQRYLNDLQRVISRYMIRSGFSVGISDLIVHSDIRNSNEQKIVDVKKDVVDMTKKVHLNIFENVSKGVSELYEAKIQKSLGVVRENIEKNTTKSLDMSNRVNYIVTSGSKGNATNISQMSCLLAQQMVDGKRIPLGFNDRSLPHYSRYDNGIESRGFIVNNFKDGLSPQEFFFHAMAGREGLIDTAVKTAKSGYLQRKLIKATEDLKANHDYTVRNSNGNVIQFVYGEDGFNPIYLEIQGFDNLLLISQDKLDKDYLFDKDVDWSLYSNQKVVSKMKEDSSYKSKIDKYNKRIKRIITELHEAFRCFIDKDDKKSVNIPIYFPINFKRLINKACDIYHLNGKNKSDVSPLYIADVLDKLHKHCHVNNKTNLVFEALLIDKLSPIKLVRDKRITKVALEHIVNEIKIRFKNSLVQGGEMVGPVAAQSIGEISTQLTLNTFHYAGVGEKSSVNQGVPRLEELMENRTNLKKPELHIFIAPEFSKTKEGAEQVMYNLELVRIADILKSDAIYLEPTNDLSDVLEEDMEIMKIYEIFSELDQQAQSIPNNPWIIRLEFNRREMINKKIMMEDIHLILKQHLPNASIIYSDDNSGKLIFRLRLKFDSNNDKSDDDINLLTSQIDNIKDIVIKGVDGIEKVYPPKKNINLLVKKGDIYETDEEYYLETSGSNLFDVLTKSYIDSTRTVSISVNEVYQVLGIEAANWMLNNQFNDVFTRSNQTTSHRHIDLLCDIMTNRGNIMAANRNGINQLGNDIGPLAKSSFEETTERLKRAGIFGDFDKIDGVSSNIMVGQIPKCGTGDSEILLDELKLTSIDDDEIVEEEPDMTEIFSGSEYCMDNQNIKFNVNAIKSDNVSLDDLPEIVVEL